MITVNPDIKTDGIITVTVVFIPETVKLVPITVVFISGAFVFVIGASVLMTKTDALGLRLTDILADNPKIKGKLAECEANMFLLGNIVYFDDSSAF